MALQHEAAEGKGLPTTACAPDLFTRIAGLNGLPDNVRDFPVRWFLGWKSKAVLDYKVTSWQAKLEATFWPPKELPHVVKVIWRTIIRFPATVVWILGFFADLATIDQWGNLDNPDPRMRLVKADIQAKSIIAQFTGGDLEWQTQIDVYARNWLTPNLHIDAGQAIAAYLADELTDEEVADYTRMNNLCSIGKTLLIDTQKRRLNEQQWTDLLYRDVVKQDDFAQGLRELGWLDAQWVNYVQVLHTWWPDQGTAVDWMRRSVESSKGTENWQLDTGFEDAYDEQAKKWFKNLGVDQANAQRMWRAQFQALDVSSAITLFRRSSAHLMPDGVTFGEDDLKAAIRFSTVPPAYRAAMFTLRWEFLGFRQLKSAYDENLISEDFIQRRLLADGFSPDDAGVLLSEWEKLKPRYRRRLVGAPDASGLVRLFAAGEIGTAEFSAEIQAEGFTDDEASQALQEARTQRIRQHRGELIKTLRQQYLSGLVDEIRITNALLATGMDTEDVVSLVGLWRAELELRPARVSAGEMVGWYKQGIIRESDLAQGLAQLRYTPEDSARIIAAAELAKLGGQLDKAEKQISQAKRGVSQDTKVWSDAIKEAEKLYGKVSQRTRTKAGQQMAWVKEFVTGTVVPVMKRAQPTPPLAETPANDLDAAAQWVDGNGATLSGDSVADAASAAATTAQAQLDQAAAPIAATAAPDDQAASIATNGSDQGMAGGSGTEADSTAT